MRETGSVNSDHQENSITLTGTKEEVNLIRQMMCGAHWLTMTSEAGLQSAERFKPLPSPIEDPMIPPKWGYKMPPLGTANEGDFAKAQDAVRPPKLREDVEPDEGWHTPSIYVKHLVGYNWRTTSYEAEAKKMFAWGFECLRSRRGNDGKFWEVWYLPGLWAVRGRLKEEVVDKFAKDATWLHQAREVVQWLCRNVSFGCLDVTVQRAAMVIE